MNHISLPLKTFEKTRLYFTLPEILTGTKEAFAAEQKAYLPNKEKYQFDENLSIFRVTNFAVMLSKLDLNVTAH